MRGVAGVDEREPCAVEIDLVQVVVVGVLAGLATHAGDPGRAMYRVDLDEILGPPGTRRERVLELSIVRIEVVLAPSRAVGPPDEVAAGLHVTRLLRLQSTPVALLGEDGL